MAYLNLTALQSNMRGINAISYCSAEWQQPLILRPLQRYIFSSNLHIITFASSLFLYYLLCLGVGCWQKLTHIAADDGID